MLIRDATQATDQAKELLGNPPFFVPLAGKRIDQRWVVKATFGTVDKIEVEIKMPERLVGVT